MDTINTGMNERSGSGEAHKEGAVARTIENQTAKLPSDTYLWLAAGAIGLSAALEVFGRKDAANFVGHWPATFLLLGVYNKIVKVAGSDSTERTAPMSGKRFAA